MIAVKYVVFTLVLISCPVYSLYYADCTVDVCKEMCKTWRVRQTFSNGSNCRTTCYRCNSTADCDSDINIMCRMIYAYCRQCTTEQEDVCNSSTAINAVIGLIVSVVILIGIFLVIRYRYFMKMKSRKGTKSQPVSYVDDKVNGITGEIHNMAISENTHVHKEIDSDSDSDYTLLNNTTTETNRYAHASYQGDGQEQSTPTVSAVELKDSSEHYYTLPKEQEKESDVILKQKEPQSNYMFLVHNTSTATITDPPAPQNEVESDYSDANFPGKCGTDNAEMPNEEEDGTQMGDQDDGVNKQNLPSLQNDGSYGNLGLVGNDSTDDSYYALNRQTNISCQDDITDDYNKLIPTPTFD